MLMVILSESVRNKQNRRNKKELQQQQLLDKHHPRPQQRPRRQHQQQPRQRRQHQPKQKKQSQNNQRQSRRRPKVGSPAQAQGFNLPDLKKLPNTKFDCDENKRLFFILFLFIHQDRFPSFYFQQYIVTKSNNIFISFRQSTQEKTFCRLRNNCLKRYNSIYSFHICKKIAKNVHSIQIIWKSFLWYKFSVFDFLGLRCQRQGQHFIKGWKFARAKLIFKC